MILTFLFQTGLPQDLITTQVVFTLDTLNTSRRKDIPPDYRSVVQMKKQEEEDLPSYHQAVAANTEGCVLDGGVVEAISELEKRDISNVKSSKSIDKSEFEFDKI